MPSKYLLVPVALAVVFVFGIISPAGAAEDHKLAFSKRLGVEVWAMDLGQGWCIPELNLKVKAQNDAFFKGSDFQDLISLVGSRVLPKECPQAKSAIIHGNFIDGDKSVGRWHAGALKKWEISAIQDIPQPPSAAIAPTLDQHSSINEFKTDPQDPYGESVKLFLSKSAAIKGTIKKPECKWMSYVFQKDGYFANASSLGISVYDLTVGDIDALDTIINQCRNSIDGYSESLKNYSSPGKTDNALKRTRVLKTELLKIAKSADELADRIKIINAKKLDTSSEASIADELKAMYAEENKSEKEIKTLFSSLTLKEDGVISIDLIRGSKSGKNISHLIESLRNAAKMRQERFAESAISALTKMYTSELKIEWDKGISVVSGNLNTQLKQLMGNEYVEGWTPARLASSVMFYNSCSNFKPESLPEITLLKDEPKALEIYQKSCRNSITELKSAYADDLLKEISETPSTNGYYNFLSDVCKKHENAFPQDKIGKACAVRANAIFATLKTKEQSYCIDGVAELGIVGDDINIRLDASESNKGIKFIDYFCNFVRYMEVNDSADIKLEKLPQNGWRVEIEDKAGTLATEMYPEGDRGILKGTWIDVKKPGLFESFSRNETGPLWGLTMYQLNQTWLREIQKGKPK